MVFDVPRRYFRNLRGFIIAKPPCVIFTLCLACLAVALFFLGYYVNNHEIVDPEAEQGWDDFMTGLSNIQFCIDQDMVTKGNNIGTTSSSNSTEPRTDKILSSFQKDVQHISVPLKIGVNVWNKLHHLRGNITHLTTLVDSPITLNGDTKSKMNLTFSLSKIWNTERKCNSRDKCVLPQEFFQTCVKITAPPDVLPEWKPGTCNFSTVVSITTMRPLSKKAQQSKSCKSGAIIYVKHPVDLELREKLSVDEKAKANLHLQITSYFLFVLVITSVIYGMLKGKPIKSKKVAFESVG